MAEVLWRIGGVEQIDVLVAAILHDTLEDTETTLAELTHLFGERVSRIVSEVTDDKSLPKQVRKQQQIDHAPFISREAKLVKLGDKICNIEDVCAHPPTGWLQEQKQEYLDWAEQVIRGVRGTNMKLEAEFDRLLQEGKTKLLV